MNDKHAPNRVFDPADYQHADSESNGSTKPVENVALLPDLCDPYKADGFVGDEASCLVVIMGKDGFLAGETAYHLLQYVHIGLGQFGFTASGGQRFTFPISDIQPKLLTVHGRNLLRMFHQIGLRRVPWIRQADRDFRKPGPPGTEPFISRIEVANWKPERGQAETQPEMHGVES